MRLRHIPGAEQQIEDSEYVIQNPREIRGHWAELFGSDGPIHMEIGMGKGRFLMELAAANPRINYVGVERYSTVLLKAIQKQRERKLPNVRFLRVDALELPEYFGRGEIGRIYLNFSDPWPKDRHAKRRLTSPRFLNAYGQILADGGTLEFKTDNQALFQYSLESIPAAGWKILMETGDLHHSPYGAGNVMTEYEEKFSSLGNPICKLIAAVPETKPAAVGIE